MFPKNTKVQVIDSAPFHANRIGYVEFYGEGPSDGAVVLRDPDQSTVDSTVLFAVANEAIKEI